MMGKDYDQVVMASSHTEPESEMSRSPSVGSFVLMHGKDSNYDVISLEDEDLVRESLEADPSTIMDSCTESDITDLMNSVSMGSLEHELLLATTSNLERSESFDGKLVEEAESSCTQDEDTQGLERATQLERTLLLHLHERVAQLEQQCRELTKADAELRSTVAFNAKTLSELKGQLDKVSIPSLRRTLRDAPSTRSFLRKLAQRMCSEKYTRVPICSACGLESGARRKDCYGLRCSCRVDTRLRHTSPSLTDVLEKHPMENTHQSSFMYNQSSSLHTENLSEFGTSSSKRSHLKKACSVDDDRGDRHIIPDVADLHITAPSQVSTDNVITIEDGTDESESGSGFADRFGDLTPLLFGGDDLHGLLQMTSQFFKETIGGLFSEFTQSIAPAAATIEGDQDDQQGEDGSPSVPAPDTEANMPKMGASAVLWGAVGYDLFTPCGPLGIQTKEEETEEAEMSTIAKKVD
eukprot:Colp12_sorted_trinity150504_noHs@33741